MIGLQHYHRYEFALLLAEFQEKTVLDIACGEGYGSDILATQAKKVYGVDISREAINWAKQTYQNEKLRFLVGSVTQIPLPDKTVDIVVSFETIEHHDQHREMIAEIKRVLRDDGILIISSPNKDYFEKYLPGQKNEFHVKELYRREFEALLGLYFKNYYSFTQSNLYGSAITCDGDYARSFSRPYHFNKTYGTAGFLEPRFNIAVAGDNEMEFNITTSFCTYNSEKDILAELEYKNQLIEAIYSSMTWKTIAFIKKPFAFVKKIMSALFAN
jgi:ubiquinone/menaquinone biosynthesis C-methylase UbiE